MGVAALGRRILEYVETPKRLSVPMFQIKICGVTSVADARAVVGAGADAIGLNFYRGSPRLVDEESADAIARLVPPHVAKVGVFVNHPVEAIVALRQRLGLDYVQLHGDEPWEDVARLGAAQVIRAFRCRSQGLASVREFVEWCRARDCQPASILLDAYQPGQYGGTGACVDWQAVRGAADWLRAVPVTLAGGLNPDNVADAVRAARPDAVDTASGVESNARAKDPDKLVRFVRNAREAFERLASPPA